MLPVSEKNPNPVCGIVMPISAIDGCSEGHWSEVHQILLEAIEDAGFDGNIVSNADDVGIIQKRIIQNLYENPVVVCDVSGKNPNVMFELGLRLAFDRPTIIVKDDRTSYSFDTAQIEHLEYPRDLRFAKIVDFKEKLSEKIQSTYQRATSDPEYTTFLKHFGEFKIAKIEKKEVSGQEFILDELKSVRTALQKLEQARYVSTFDASTFDAPERKKRLEFCCKGISSTDIEAAVDKIKTISGVATVEIRKAGDHLHIRPRSKEGADQDALFNSIQPFVPQRPRSNPKGSMPKADKEAL